jgi:hypothetical protein
MVSRRSRALFNISWMRGCNLKRNAKHGMYRSHDIAFTVRSIRWFCCFRRISPTGIQWSLAGGAKVLSDAWSVAKDGRCSRELILIFYQTLLSKFLGCDERQIGNEGSALVPTLGIWSTFWQTFFTPAIVSRRRFLVQVPRHNFLSRPVSLGTIEMANFCPRR